jgi:type VI secretion system protein ImpM
MFGLWSKARTEIGPVAGFGKVPALADFVRTPSPSDEVIAFETWLTRAMETAETRGSQAFRAAFAAAGPSAFIWSGALDKKLRGVLAGVVSPSHDSVGRRFPVVICAPLPPAALAPHPHLAPILLHGFFRHAAAAAARAARTQASSEFHAQVASSAGPSLDGASQALADYATWTKASRAAALWSSLFVDDADHAAQSALHLLIEATATYHGQDAPPLPLGVRVPLGPQETMAMAMWIDLVRVAAGWKSTVPSLFWLLASSDPRPSAIVQLGAEPPPTVLADLTMPSPESDAICDLGAAGANVSLPSQFPAALGATLGTPNVTIADVIAKLAR